MLQHLYTSYEKITPQDLQHLDEDMKTPYDPHMPIENLFDQIEHAQDLAEAAGAPYADSRLLNAAYNLVFTTNVFNEICREWRRLQADDVTWAKFKIIFTQMVGISDLCSYLIYDLTQSTRGVFYLT